MITTEDVIHAAEVVLATHSEEEVKAKLVSESFTTARTLGELALMLALVCFRQRRYSAGVTPRSLVEHDYPYSIAATIAKINGGRNANS